MIRPGPATVLRVYMSESDKWHHQPVYLALVERAHRAGLAGATIIPSRGGIGSNGLFHSGMNDILMADMPLVVEIVDTPEAIAAFLPVVHEMLPEGLVTTHDVVATRAAGPAIARATVETVATAACDRVGTVSPDTPVKDLAERLLAGDADYLYVEAVDGRAVGVVGRRDLLSQVLTPHPSALALLTDRLPGLGHGELHKRLEQAHAFTADQVMTREVIGVRPDAPLADAVRLMLERGWQAVPILLDGRVVGVVTQRDVLRRQLGAAARDLGE